MTEPATSTARAAILDRVPAETLGWLLEPENPAVSVLTRRTLLAEPDTAETRALWARRNEYEPVAAILAAQHHDGSWDAPARDYQKYGGSLWQLVFLGELWADGGDPRVQLAAQYAFSRQTAHDEWCANAGAHYHMPCLTANVGRGLARMGWARDERVIAALASIADGYRRLGYLGCSNMQPMSLNGYCHMLAPKVLLFLGEVPGDLWPDGAEELRDACVEALRDKQIYRSLPDEYPEFRDAVWPAKAAVRQEVRDRFVAEHQPLHYGEKPGWTRFGYPLSYNSDALEALAALQAVGGVRRAEYEPALELVRSAADDRMRWTLRTSFNGKMHADIERKGRPSKWLTLRALHVLEWFDH